MTVQIRMPTLRQNSAHSIMELQTLPYINLDSHVGVNHSESEERFDDVLLDGDVLGNSRRVQSLHLREGLAQRKRLISLNTPPSLMRTHDQHHEHRRRSTLKTRPLFLSVDSANNSGTGSGILATTRADLVDQGEYKAGRD